MDAAALGFGGGALPAGQDRADHLAADEQRLAGRLAVLSTAHLAGEDLVAGRTLVDRPAEAHREAAARLRVLERLGERGVLGKVDGGLEAVAAVVADQDGDRRVGRAGLEVADEQLVALALVLGDLHRLAEAGLAVGVVAVRGLAGMLEVLRPAERTAGGGGEGASERARDDAEDEKQPERRDRGGP